MLARLEHENEGQEVSDELKAQISDLFNTAYAYECQKLGRTFEIFCFTYPSELLLIISFIDSKDENALPISCFLSVDLDKKSQDMKLISKLIDVSGRFFDTLFADEEWNDYGTRWEEVTVDKFTFFFKITRENIALTLEANRLLREH